MRVAPAQVMPDILLRDAKFVILVLGKEKNFEAPLASLGKVTRIDIAIPK